MIDHTQVRFTADQKWVDGNPIPCRNGLEQNKFVTIPLVNEPVGIVAASRVEIGKGEESVTIDVKRLHIAGSIILKRPNFDNVSTGD